MSLLKKLQIGDNAIGRYNKEYLLVDYKCHTFRRHNEYRPDADMICDRIDMTIIAPGMEDMSVYNWFIQQTTIDGRLQIELPAALHQDSTEYKTIEFEGASCFQLEEHYEINHNRRRVLHLSMIADHVTIEGVVFKRH